MDRRSSLPSTYPQLWTAPNGPSTFQPFPTPHQQSTDAELAAMLSPLSLSSKPIIELQLDANLLYKRRASLQKHYSSSS